MTEPEYTYHPACRVSDIEDDRGVPVEIGPLVIAIFRHDGRYFAIDDACPHKGVPLCDGLVDSRVVTCTWHGWRFCLETGRGMDGNRTGVATYPVRVSGDIIEVGVPASA